MKLTGQTGDVVPGGMPSTLPQRMTRICCPFKWSFKLWVTWFQLPPSAGNWLQDGNTTPPTVSLGPDSAFQVLVMVSNLTPPPVIQQRLGGAQMELLIRKSPSKIWAE